MTKREPTMKLCSDCKHRMGVTCYRPDHFTGIGIAISCEAQRGLGANRCGMDAEYWSPSIWYKIKRIFGVKR